MATLGSPSFTEKDGSKPISTIVFIIAMKTEALPILKKFDLTEDTTLFPMGTPWIRYHGIYKDLQLNVVLPGKDFVFEVDNVGTIPAALVTYSSIQLLKPDLIINAGTAGGFVSKGVGIGDVFLISNVSFHDQRIPLPGFDLFGVGLRHPLFTPSLLKELNLKAGKLSTGDSFDMSPEDEALVESNGANLIDMEGAAVAYVADLLKVPAMFLKVCSNGVDGGNPSVEEFRQHLAAAATKLGLAIYNLLDSINGKHLHEL